MPSSLPCLPFHGLQAAQGIAGLSLVLTCHILQSNCALCSGTQPFDLQPSFPSSVFLLRYPFDLEDDVEVSEMTRSNVMLERMEREWCYT